MLMMPQDILTCLPRYAWVCEAIVLILVVQ